MAEPEVMIKPTKLLPPDKVFELWGEPFTPSWLERRRYEGGGPKFVKAGRGRTAKVYYRAADIEAWIAASVRASTSDHGGGEG